MKYVLAIVLQLSFVATALASGLHFCFNSTNNDLELEDFASILQAAAQEVESAITASKFGHSLSDAYDNFHVEFAHPALTLNGNFSNGSAIIDAPQLRLFTIVPGGLEIFNYSFNFFANGSYDIDGYIGKDRLFDIYGEGEFFLKLSNFSISVIGSLEVNSSSICVPTLMQMYVKKCENDFMNFMDGDEDLYPLINSAFSVIIPEAIKTFFREDADLVDPFLQKIIDFILNTEHFETLPKLFYLIDNYPHLIHLITPQYKTLFTH